MGQSIGGDEVHGDSYELSGDFRQATLNFGVGLPALSPTESAALLAEYRAAVLADTTHVDLRGVPLPRAADGRRVDPHLPLERVYVRLRAVREERQRRVEEARRREIEGQTDERDEAGLAGRLGNFFYDSRAARPADSPIDPEAALREHGRLVVLGPPGAGKSTLLRLLARRAAADVDGPLPLRVSLGRYAAQLSRGDVALVDFALEGIPEQRRAAVGAAIERGGVLWLLDALDEAQEHAPRVLAQLATLPGQLALTSRPLGYAPGPAGDLPHFDLLPLESGDADAFLTNWFGALAEAQRTDDAWAASRVKATRARLDDRPGLRPLLGNPLLLTFVAVLADRDPAEALPEHRAGLYRRYLEELLDSWEGARRARAGAAELAVGPLRGEAARAALRDGVVWLGWWLHLTYYGGRAARPPLQREAIDALAVYFRAAVDYDDLRRHEARAAAGDVVAFWREAGLLDVWQLRAAGGPADFLAFRHLTFQEYGAAVVLAGAWGAGHASTRRIASDRERAWAFLRPRLHHRAWREPLLLLGGLLGAAEGDALLGAVLAADSPYEAVLRRDLRAGAALAGEGKGQDGPGHMALAEQWVEVIRREHLVPTRSSVTAALSRRPGPRAATTWMAKIESELLAALGDSRGDVRQAAAWVLGLISDGAAVPGQLAALRDEVGFVRQAAAGALGEIGDAAAVPDLMAALEGVDQGLTNWAAGSLGQIGDPRAIAALSQAAGDGNFTAFLALRQIGDPALLFLLRNLRADDRATCWNALKLLFGYDLKARVTETVDNACRHSDPAIREAASAALALLVDPAAVPALLERLGDDEEIARAVAIDLLSRIGEPALPALLDALGSDSEVVRMGAGVALGRMQPPGAGAVALLVAAMRSGDDQIAFEAMQTVDRIVDPAAVPAFRALLRETSEALARADGSWKSDPADITELRLRERAVKALCRIGTPGAVLALLAERRWAFALVFYREIDQALDAIANPTSIPALVEALRDDDAPAVRWAVVPALLEGLQDSDAQVRQEAVQALGAAGDRTALPALLAAMEDGDEAVQRAAVGALGALGDPLAVPVLTGALQTRWSLAHEAADALLNIKDPAAVAAVVEAMRERAFSPTSRQYTLLGNRAADLLRAAARNNPHLRGEAERAIAAIDDPAALPALLRALRDDAGGIRRTAVIALGRLAAPETIPPAGPVLFAALDDPDAQVRAAAIDALGPRVGLAPLLAAAQADDLHVRRAALAALGTCGDSIAVSLLLAALKEDKTRRVAITALGEIGDPTAVPELIRILDDSDRWTREAAVIALGRIADPTAVPTLQRLLTDPDWEVRRRAVEALARINHPAAIPALREALRVRLWDERQTAITALCRIDDPAVIPVLREALEIDDGTIRDAAAEALVRRGVPAGIPHIVHAVWFAALPRRVQTIEALGRIEDPGVVPVLLQLLQLSNSNTDEWPVVSQAVDGALGRLSYTILVPGLLSAIDNDTREVPFLAHRKLDEIRDTEALPALLAALTDADTAARRAAIEALGRMGDAAVPGLLGALQNGAGNVPYQAAHALGRIGDAAAVPGLLATLRSKDGGLRLIAVEALGEIGDAAAVPGLLAALLDEDGDVCRAAIRALGEIGDAAAVRGLLSTLWDRDGRIRQVSAEALGKIGDDSVLPALLKMLSHKESEERRAAATAIERIGAGLPREPLIAAADELSRQALADPARFSEEAFRILEQFTARLSTFDAAALPADDLLLPSTLPADSVLHKR